MEKKRLNYIDIAKGIAILSVMYVHIPNEYQIFNIGVTWHLSVFFIVSGILEISNTKSMKDYFLRSLSSIMKPYFILSIIYIVIFTIVNLITNTPTHIIRDSYLTLSLSGIGTLWFLPSFFGGKQLFHFVHLKFKNIGLALLGVFSIICMFLCQYLYSISFLGSIVFNAKGVIQNLAIVIFQIIAVSGFMVFGYFFALFKKEKPMFFNSKPILLACAIALLFMNYILYKNFFKENLHCLIINSAIVYIVCSLCGAIGIIFISSVIENLKIFNFLKYAGKNSLIIMTTHLEYKVIDLVILSTSFLSNSYFKNFLVFVVLILIELLICYIINRIPFLRYIYFKKFNNKIKEVKM